MERIGVVSLVNDPACVACRRFRRPRCLPRSFVVERGGQPRRHQRRLLRNSDDLLNALPAVVTGFARRGALGAERELARSVAGISCAGGVGRHQRGTRARAQPPVPARLLGRGEHEIREIDRVIELTTMAIAPARQVQRVRLSELIGENDRGRALEGVRIERRREVRHRRHGLSLPSTSHEVEREIAVDQGA